MILELVAITTISTLGVLLIVGQFVGLIINGYKNGGYNND